MSLDKDNIIMIFGNNAKSFASLEELKNFIGSGSGSVADDPDFITLNQFAHTNANQTNARFQEVDVELSKKLELSGEAPQESASIIFLGGKWVVQNPEPS